MEQMNMEQMNMERMPIGKAQLREAMRTLRRYKAGKANLEARIVENDRWWRLRHFETMDRQEFGEAYPSAWLFNSIMGKHAAAMEAYPQPNILPREQDDEQEAELLSSVVPVIMEANDYKETYSVCQWRKMQSGTSITGVFWDSGKLGGLGDVSILPVNILNLFWEPGVRDIQLSRNLFHVELADVDALRSAWPDKRIPESGDALALARYFTEDNVPAQGKRLVVDWYYKKKNGMKTELHLCKFVGDTLLYSSENEGHPWYNDGLYPFVLDVLFPMEGSPAGFGFIDTGKYAQKQIDMINQAIITNALMNCRPRYFQQGDSGINEQEFCDWSRQVVHVEGTLSDVGLRPIQSGGLDSVYVSVLQSKIQELKETTSNQDVQTGRTAGGVTAASAIMALQESAGMPSKDATRGSYRAYEEIVRMVIERIRQFYDMPRMFRIRGEGGKMRFLSFDNRALQVVSQGVGLDGADMGMRLPEFDIEVVAQAETPYTKLSNNTLILDLLQRGLFNPQNADVAGVVLDMLDMPRKDKLMARLGQMQTAREKMKLYAELALALARKYEPELADGLLSKAQEDIGAGSIGAGSAGSSGFGKGSSALGGSSETGALVRESGMGKQNAARTESTKRRVQGRVRHAFAPG